MNKKRILLVDDEVGFTRLLQLNLHWTGRYIVRAENSGTAALAALRDFHPDLILLDVMMPGMDGGDLAARLQNNPHTREIPIVFVTAAVSWLSTIVWTYIHRKIMNWNSTRLIF